MSILNDRGRAARPHVWAIGGGKGGVGKSVISANLGVALAQRKQRVVVLDADLGGANLHTLFGMQNPRRTLSDFISRRVASLDDVRVATPVSGVWLISGARALLEMANPRHTQKTKLLRHISGLDADHVVLDLGAGSAFNVLDFFLFAERGILVVVPEPTSVENAYHFLKSAFFRFLKQAEPRDQVRAVLSKVAGDLEKRGIRSPRQLIAHAMDEDEEVGRSLRAQAEAFTPGILVNRVQLAEHRTLGEDIGIACRDYFGAEVDFLGCVDSDTLVPHSIVRRQPILEIFPGSPFGRGIDALADRLLKLAETSNG